MTQTTPLAGADEMIGSLRLREITNVALLSLAIPQGGEKSVSVELKRVGLAMPDDRTTTTSKSVRAARTTPDQMILFFDEAEAIIPKKIQADLAEVGYVTVQTDSWVICELSGTDAILALERICPIDLHNDAFPVGAFARTTMEHLGAAIIRTSETSYLLMSASSSAASFWYALTTSAKNVCD